MQTYERRAQVVRPGKEVSYWSNVTADMMSNEEKVGDKYVRHPPSYRSEKFSKFLLKLDERAALKSKSHARFKREEGSPRNKLVPPTSKQWMIKKDFRAATQTASTLIMDSDVDLSD